MTAQAFAPTELPTLSAQLREGTRAVHDSAENSDFIARLMKGELNRAAYADFAAQHLAIYTALEAASAKHAAAEDPRGRSLLFDELLRTPSIETDLAFLFGENWVEEIDVLPATLDYAARIAEIGGSLPHYAAHAYTRYLGDLSGGQIIQRMLQRHYGFGAEGVSFYTFAEIPKSKPFKDVYRERLDGLNLTPDEITETVSEAQRAFQLNQSLFEALAKRH